MPKSNNGSVAEPLAEIVDSTAITIIQPDYAIFSLVPALKNEAMNASFEEEGIEDSLFNPYKNGKIPVPKAGAKTWEYTDPLTGDEIIGNKELVALIAGVSPSLKRDVNRKAYFENDMGEGSEGQRPDCLSIDGIKGYGRRVITLDIINSLKLNGKIQPKTYTGEQLCSKCALNRFGSKGKGKACRDKKVLHLILPDNLSDRNNDNISFTQHDETIVLEIPPTSIGRFMVYLGELDKQGLKFHDVVTVVTTEKAEGGYGHTLLNFKVKAVINDELRPQIKEYVDLMESKFNSAKIVIEEEIDMGGISDNGEPVANGFDDYSDFPLTKATKQETLEEKLIRLSKEAGFDALVTPKGELETIEIKNFGGLAKTFYPDVSSVKAVYQKLGVDSIESAYEKTEIGQMGIKASQGQMFSAIIIHLGLKFKDEDEETF